MLRPPSPKYGFVNHALELLIVRKFGEEVWDNIWSRLEGHVGSPFIVRMLCDDNVTFNIVNVASEVTQVSQNKIWEMFGDMFFDFCKESGYEKIVRGLGRSLKDVLQNLDTIHDHLASLYPGMRAPSFRVTERADGSLLLYYYSERNGLEYIIIGLVQAIARELHNKTVDVDILSTHEDHVEFLITDAHSAICGRQDVDADANDVEEESDEDEILLLSQEPKISPSAFCKAFPFHMMLNREMQIVQAGKSIARVIKEIDNPTLTFNDIFQVVRPQIELDFDEICTHHNSAFVVRVKDKVRLSPRRSVCHGQIFHGGRLVVPSPDGDSAHRKKMFLKGQMVHLVESEHIVFLCSPAVTDLEDLMDRGLFLSDLPIHDSMRDLVLLSEQFRAEYDLTQKLEMINDKMQQTYRELEIEKQLTDKLVYSILPPSVANKLRLGEPVEAVKYDSVSILFSGICDFNTFCTNNSPMKVVNLLNEIYTKFDALADPRIYDVYKVETVGDKYMLASGLPEKSSVHARNIARVALDMLDIVRDICIYEQPVRVHIGIHSGEVVAGVVGQKLPHYAVFGNTVCLASRMESTGAPDCINISDSTYRLLQKPECVDEEFFFKSRGELYIKGARGPMKCYFLSRNTRKPLKVHNPLLDGEHLSPSPGCSPGELADATSEVHMRRYAGLRGSFGSYRDGTSSVEDLSRHLPDSTTHTLICAAYSLSNILQERRGSSGSLPPNN